MISWINFFEASEASVISQLVTDFAGLGYGVNWNLESDIFSKKNCCWCHRPPCPCSFVLAVFCRLKQYVYRMIFYLAKISFMRHTHTHERADTSTRTHTHTLAQSRTSAHAQTRARCLLCFALCLHSEFFSRRENLPK